MYTYIPIRREIFHHNRELRLLTFKRTKSEQALLAVIGKSVYLQVHDYRSLNFVKNFSSNTFPINRTTILIK